MSSPPDIAAGRLAADDYARNFSDLHPPLTRHEARVAAERCLFCYDAPCIKACPTGIDIPMFIRQIMTGNTVGAAKTILDANIMGGMCSRVCPTETLCEEACVREASEGRAVEIGQLQRYATDDLFAKGRQLYHRGPATGRRIAVVGAGPAGLACAHRLAALGHEVVVYEAREKGGGLNEYGIAAYKSTEDFAQREVDYITGIGGITVEYGQRLGRDITLAGLRQAFDAVFLAIGLGDTNDLGLEDGLDGVVDAVDYIAGLRQAADLAGLPVGRSIVVIGGGMTAIDIASQTRRLGAESVTIAYRRGEKQMNASDYEQELAQTDGVLIRHWLKPARLVGEAGRLVAVELEYTREEGGRLVGTGERLTLPCDQLFAAIGQSLLPADIDGVPLTMEKGRIKVDAERRTSVPGIWAGGDCVAGGKDLTVAAVEDGKQAALSIDRALKAATAVAAA
ncbi:NAD(P)-dependent oxidoreductase [Labrys wisconsinensis]|uniref:dihydrouracil dehydrogenase (NAD(+)) n=1 Tax=Labrys wisconsinensis TaxID=425677 RepID=A0ABU0J825_9HYPH|nr:NAD(P)-dependent oxidoreductase [Labrys wisconsinensis]MDQ0469755.1 glutamate synthase (NADPH/NADH) small chain [Labrys wisconsinensis]